MIVSIRGPVGDLSHTRWSGNQPVDVRALASALEVLDPDSTGTAPGSNGENLVEMIHRFQRLFMKRTDGRVDPGGRTLRALNRLLGGKSIVISLKREVLKAMQGGKRIFLFDSASGSTAHPTPPGLFQVYRKHKVYRSKTYDVQMDYAMFFHRGYAIHMAYGVAVTSFLKYGGYESIGSHGCVRLSETNAKQLFEWTPMQAPVLVWPERKK